MRGAGILRLAARLGVALAGAASLAATAQGLQATEPATVQCMTPAPSQAPAVRYPPDMLERRESGEITVTMEFDAPDRPPRTTVERDFGAVGRAMAEAIQPHLNAIRIPCLTAPVRLTQTFAFVPNAGGKIAWTRPQRVVRSGEAEPLGCVTRPSSSTVGSRPFEWGRFTESRVLLDITFVAPDQPPRVTVVAPSPIAALTRDTVERAEEMRMPCHAGEPVTAQQLYVYRKDGRKTRALNDLGLAAFLGHVKDVARVPVYFDFGTMGCPFEVSLRLWTPHRRNDVGVIGPPHPGRRPFLDWLAGLALDLPASDLTALLGETMTVAVPCGTLDL